MIPTETEKTVTVGMVPSRAGPLRVWPSWRVGVRRLTAPVKCRRGNWVSGLLSAIGMVAGLLAAQGQPWLASLVGTLLGGAWVWVRMATSECRTTRDLRVSLNAV